MTEQAFTGTITLDGQDYDLTGSLKARPPSTAAAIRAAALTPAGSPHALPLAASWCTGTRPGSFDPLWQLGQIRQGRHLYPWFQFPDVGQPPSPEATAYYQLALTACRAQGLPITLVGTQWEQLLYQESETLNLPPAENPNVVLSDGTVRPQLSPFGAAPPWFTVGKRWTATALMRQIQGWYPDPPRVILLSNNEAQKLRWVNATDDRRCPPGLNDEQKRKAVGDGWISRYRLLQDGMRAGLTPAWAAVTRFWGYAAFGPECMGRWAEWNDYSLAISGRLDPHPLMWDGGSPPYYTSGGTGETDFTVQSPQLEAMNQVPMRAEAAGLNPSFDLELSCWDGWEPGGNDMRAYYRSLGQTYTPARYGGYAQFGLWLLRPRVVRDYRNWADTLVNSEPYFQAVAASCDRVHNTPELKRFWQRGQLVANSAALHPYQLSLTSEQRALARWYGLDTSLDPPRPWALSTPLPVRALALGLGTAPQREWLIYAHAPVGDKNGVKVTLPGGRVLPLDVPVAGRFWRVDEATGTVKVL